MANRSISSGFRLTTCVSLLFVLDQTRFTSLSRANGDVFEGNFEGNKVIGSSALDTLRLVRCTNLGHLAIYLAR